MAMVDIPVLERDIQQFVFDCTGERVKLSLGTEGEVSIVSISRHGSTTLGIFWVRVLQHPNNYPVHQYPYRQLYRAAGKHVISLRVDSVTISVCLASGKLTISGAVALDWFTMRFAAMMNVYILPISKAQALKMPFDAEEKRLIRTVKKQMLQQYLQEWPDVVVKQDMDVLNARQLLAEQSEGEQGSGDTLPVGPLLGEKLTEEYHIDNLLSPKALDDQLEKLKQGMMIDGATLYSTWSSLLNRWFSKSNVKVFVITAAIDTSILQRLCHIVLNHRVTANLQMLATPLQSRCGHMADIRRTVMLQLPPRDQVFAEYKVYNTMVYPPVDFQAKFIAGLCGESVEVLLTSADAEDQHFQEKHASMVHFQTLSAKEFDSHFLGPIIKS